MRALAYSVVNCTHHTHDSALLTGPPTSSYAPQNHFLSIRRRAAVNRARYLLQAHYKSKVLLHTQCSSTYSLNLAARTLILLAVLCHLVNKCVKTRQSAATHGTAHQLLNLRPSSAAGSVSLGSRRAHNESHLAAAHPTSSCRPFAHSYMRTRRSTLSLHLALYLLPMHRAPECFRSLSLYTKQSSHFVPHDRLRLTLLTRHFLHCK